MQDEQTRQLSRLTWWWLWLLLAITLAGSVIIVMLSRLSSPSFVLRHVLRGHGGGHIGLAFSPDGKLLAAAGSLHEEVKVWLVAKGKLIHTLSTGVRRWGQPQALCLAFSPDGQTLAVSYSDDTVRLFQVTDGKLKQHFGKPVPHLIGGGVWSVAFSPDGKLLAGGMQARKVLIWRVEDGAKMKSLPTQSFYMSCLAFSSDGQWLAAEGDGAVYLWQVNDWQFTCRLPTARFLTELAFGKNDRLLMVGGWGQVQGWTIPDSTPAFIRSLPSNFARDLAFSPDGQWVAITDTQWSRWLAWLQPLFWRLGVHFRMVIQRSGISVWRFSDGRKVAQLLRRGSGLPVGVAFSPDGRYLAVGYEYGGVAVWERRR